MDLFASSWMTRSLGEAVSAIRLGSKGGVYAGGWNGCVKSWTKDGTLEWTAALPDRVTVLHRHGDDIFATAGLHVVCIDADNGTLRWSHPLEGSADTLAVFDGALYAVSSVYDIEHNDFLESAVWNFSFDGTLNWVHRMDERPWVTLEHDGELLFGLGRPKSGFSNITGETTSTHVATEADSPITSGSATSSNLFFGHADGSVSNREGATVCVLEDAIEHIIATEKECIATLDNGETVVLRNGKKAWAIEGERVSVQAMGFTMNDEHTLWTGRWSGSQGAIQIHSAASGHLLLDTPTERCESIDADAERIAIGFEDGTVRVWEQVMFERRMRAEVSVEPKDERKSALQDKLRALRDR